MSQREFMCGGSRRPAPLSLPSSPNWISGKIIKYSGNIGACFTFLDIGGNRQIFWKYWCVTFHIVKYLQHFSVCEQLGKVNLMWHDNKLNIWKIINFHSRFHRQSTESPYLDLRNLIREKERKGKVKRKSTWGFRRLSWLMCVAICFCQPI